MASSAFDRALEAFRSANRADPKHITVDGESRPFALVQAERRARWIARLAPSASEALRLATHCQHIRRWEIPRDDFPEGRVGYLKWRKTLSKFHADTAAEILQSAGVAPEIIERVRRINLKRDPRGDADTQTMEDALCLTFIEYELAEFAELHDEDKLVGIIEKTWAKMSPAAREAALELPLSAELRSLVGRALGGA